MKAILITGSTGFIGSNLLNKLIKDNYEISVLVHEGEKELLESKKKYIKNIFYWEKLENPKYIEELKMEDINIEYCIHLAAYGVSQSDNKIDKMLDINLGLLKKLILFCSAIGIGKIVNTGSGFEYGDKGNRKVKEEESLEPFSFYGASKSAALAFGRIIAKEQNIKITTLRFFNIFGVGEKEERLIPYLIKKVMKNEVLNVTEGMQIRDYLYISDVIDAYLEVIEQDLFNDQIYNVCSSYETKLRDLIEMVVAVAGLNSSIINFGAIPYRKNEAMYIVGDNKKFLSETNWKPKVSVKEGVRLMYQNFLKGE